MEARKVNVQCEALTIPTYGVNSLDPNPPIRVGRRMRRIYPYPMQDDLDSEKTDRTYEAVVLENEYLKVIVLPELGGRLYSAYDKAAGRELFYKTNVIKPGLVALRGAWIAGGVEFNFPCGHHCLTHSRVDYRILEHEDGSGSVCFGAIEQVSRMRYSVTVTLKPGRNQIFTDMRLENRTGLPHRYYFWSNSAQPATMDTRFITPATSVYGWSGIMRYPIHEGVDIAWYRNHPHAGDLFTRNLQAGFFGHYDYGANHGTVNVADPNEVTGRKYFTWGNSHDGLLWEHILSDGDGPYVEIQCGPYPTQQFFKMLDPHRVRRWKESWFGVRETEGFGFANEDVALNLICASDEPKLAVNATRQIKEATITVSQQGSPDVEYVVDLSPESPCQLPLARLDAAEPMDVVIAAQPEGQIAQATLPWKGDEDPERDPELDSSEMETVTGYLAQGDQREKHLSLAQARESYEKALAEDPLSARALVRLSVLDLKQGLWADARSHLDEALRIDDDSGEARYYRGIALRSLDLRKEARKDLWRAWLRSTTFGTTARTILGEMAVEDGDLNEALDHFEKAATLEAQGSRSHCLRCAVLREQGRVGEASALSNVAWAVDPINPLLAFERGLIAEADGREEPFADFEQIAHGESQTYIEIALDYARAGFPQTALRLLKLASDGAADAAMVRYITGYWLDRTGRTDEGRKALAAAAKMPSDYVFPHRIESEAVLKRAMELHSDDANAPFYLGTLLYLSDRKEEGRRWWTHAESLGCTNSALLRCIGYALWNDDDDPGGALEWYRKAADSRPDDYRLYSDMDDIRDALSCPPANRLAELDAIPEACKGKGTIGAKMAALCVRMGNYDRAVEILDSRRFDPWEGARELRAVYTGAHAGRGEVLWLNGDVQGARSAFEKALEYPVNVAMGKTWRPNDAPILFRAGLACEACGDAPAARAHWNEALTETHHPTSSIERTYVEMCRQKLDGGAGATALAAILSEAEARQRPSEEDRRGRRLGTNVEAFMVGGLAAFALKQQKRAVGMLERALRLQPDDLFLERLVQVAKHEA